MQLTVTAKQSLSKTPPTLLLRVESSDFLSLRHKAVYRVLYGQGPMSSKEIDKVLSGSSSSERLRELAVMGAVVSEGFKHDPEAGRKVQLWKITGREPVRVNLRKRFESSLPTANDLRIFSRHLKVLSLAAGSKGARISKQFRKVQAWLEAGAPCKHTTNHKKNNKVR